MGKIKVYSFYTDNPRLKDIIEKIEKEESKLHICNAVTLYEDISKKLGKIDEE